MAASLSYFASTGAISASTPASTTASASLLLLVLIVCLLLVTFHSVLLLLASASSCAFVLLLGIGHADVGTRSVVRGSCLIAVVVVIASLTVSTGCL